MTALNVLHLIYEIGTSRSTPLHVCSPVRFEGDLVSLVTRFGCCFVGLGGSFSGVLFVKVPAARRVLRAYLAPHLRV